jgi:hypothetical protein
MGLIGTIHHRKARIVTDSKRRKHVTPSKFINNKDLQLNRQQTQVPSKKLMIMISGLVSLLGKGELLNC